MWRPAPCAARVSLHISNLRDYSIPYPFPVGHGRIFPLTYHWTPTIPGQHCHSGGCGLVHLGHTVHSPAQIAFDQIVSRAPHEPCLPGVCNPPGYCLRPRASVFFPVLGVLLLYRLGSILSLMARRNGLTRISKPHCSVWRPITPPLGLPTSYGQNIPTTPSSPQPLGYPPLNASSGIPSQFFCFFQHCRQTWKKVMCALLQTSQRYQRQANRHRWT